MMMYLVVSNKESRYIIDISKVALPDYYKVTTKKKRNLKHELLTILELFGKKSK